MKAYLSAFVIAVTLGGQATLGGQEASVAAPTRAQKAVSSSVRADLYMAKIVVHLRDGSAVFGFLAGLEPDALVIRKGPSPVRVASTDLAKVILDVDKHLGQFMLVGLLAGVYLGNGVALRASHQPTAFIRSWGGSAWGAVYGNLIYAAGGVGLGYLASVFERGEKTFTFDENPAARLAQWERLRKYISGIARPKKLHLTLQAALVLPSATKRYSDLARGAGYTVSTGYYFYSGASSEYTEPAGRFNILRGLRLTYSIRPRVEVGAAIMFLGEPSVGAFQYGIEDKQLAVKLDSTGYFAVAAFSPLGAASSGKANWKVGLGAGAARVNFDLKLARNEYSYPYSGEVSGYSAAKNVFCSLLFTEFQVPFSKSLSVGVQADYVLMPSENVPAFPDWNLPGQKVRLGNPSVGLSFGWHF